MSERTRLILFRIEATVLAVAVLINVLAMVGCARADDAGSAEERIAKFDPHWTQLDDGSSFGNVKGDRGSRTLRCWPESGGYGCLELVVNTSAGPPIVHIWKEHMAKLPDILLPFSAAGDGYSCGDELAPIERVLRNGQVVVSNKPSTKGERWNSAIVTRHLDTSDVHGQNWFRCLDVLDLYRTGGAAVLRTDALTRRMLGP